MNYLRRSPETPLASERQAAIWSRSEGLPAEPGNPLRALSLLAESGLLAESIPDGQGAISLRALCATRMALAYQDPLYDLMFAMQGLGSYPVSLAGTPTQQAALLPGIAKGTEIGAFALTEPEAGSDISAISSRARKTATGYELSGHKAFISNAGLATNYVVFARTSSDPKRGLSAFVVPAAAAGIRVTPQTLLCGGHPIGELILDQVYVPPEALLGQEGQGMFLALSTLDLFRASVGSAAIGMAARALDLAFERVQSRRQFGQPLAEFQGTRFALAEMASELDGARLLCERAAYLFDKGHKATLESSMAKLQATEAAQRVIDRSLQLHGASGLVAGSMTERLYREIRALRIYEGTSEIQKLVIARQLLMVRPVSANQNMP